MSDQYSVARRTMVEQQLVSRGIACRRTLEAMREVPRHLFVPSQLAASAYEDRPLPIGHRATISQPYIVAMMTAELQLQPGLKVLEVGSGSGYQAAILAHMGCQVFTIEIVPELAQGAQQILQTLGFHQVNLRQGSGYLGWPEEAPFAAIVVTAAPPQLPTALVDQLQEGGRMTVPVGNPGWVQSLRLVHKVAGAMQQLELLPVSFVPMVYEA